MDESPAVKDTVYGFGDTMVIFVLVTKIPCSVPGFCTVRVFAETSHVLKSGQTANPKQLVSSAPPGHVMVPCNVMVLVEGIVNAVVTLTVE